jgi:hypothetical protein
MQESYTNLKNSKMYLKHATTVRRCLLLSFFPYSLPSPRDKLIYNIFYVSYYILYTSYFIYYIYKYMYQIKWTPLHHAAEKGHGKIVETLVEAKADPCAQDKVSVLKETGLDADRGMR